MGQYEVTTIIDQLENIAIELYQTIRGIEE